MKSDVGTNSSAQEGLTVFGACYAFNSSLPDEGST